MTHKKPRSSSSNGLRLQAKLTLAFVLVGLVGFVVAFQLLPRLILKSWTEEYESAKVPNLQTIREFYSELGPGEGVREISQRLMEAEDFKFAGPQIPKTAMDIDTLVRALSIHKEEPLDPDVLDILEVLNETFDVVRVLPYPVPPLSQGLKVLVDESGAYHLPLLAPLVTTDGKFEGTLVVSGYGSGAGSFNPYDVDEDLEGIALRLTRPDDVTFVPAESIEISNESLYEDLRTNEEKEFWEREGDDRVDAIVQLFPLRSLEKDEDGKFIFLGAFAITYKKPASLFAWNELLSGEGYIAIGVAALFALVFSYIFAKGITRPVKTLTRSVTAFADGKLDEPVRVKSRDEIGILAATFNEMRQWLQTTLKQLQERAETIESQKEELDEQFKSLQILQNYTENVLASVDSAIFSVDPSGEVRSPNRAAQSLLGLEEGNHIEDTLSETLAERLRNALDIGETTLSEEMTIETPSNEVVPVAVSVTPLREGETIIGAVAVLTDLSVIKNLEATVSRQERLAALGQLTAGVAHEIRNPLSIIKACAEILQQNFEGQPGENGLCTDIVEEADRLSRVVTEFLTFARPNEPERVPLDLNETLHRIIDRAAIGSAEGVVLEKELTSALPEVEADSDQIEQVLLNLIRNGVEAMGGGGTVIVRDGYDDADGTVWVEVVDQGSGMDDETRRRVFDPFFTSKAEGTGLGLSICHRILESHGGRIEVRDSKPGVGTTFRMTLPVHEREPVG